MPYRETDPLLPRDKPAPEIQWSRPQSINDDGDNVGSSGNEDSDPEPEPRMGLCDIFALMMGLTTLVFFLVLAFPNGWKSIWGDGLWGPRTIDERVNSILSRTPLIGTFPRVIYCQTELMKSQDGHNDLAILIRFLYNNHIYNDNFTKSFTEGGMVAQVDLPRLKQGRVGGAFWSAFVPCPANGTDFSDEAYIPSKTFHLQFLATLSLR
jgi:membrane dipeptidase